ncbi:DUF1800 domain-containing protein [Aestuariibaculum suncheonense]|uniref:DUF1800 domain-containing protein n=1 Tax=Aestuariibaculum suncheonense TaxID=1028745 RepID=A0A8J6UC38_9FLAO|nr:DUF1800 domain-containing protein [Aestuariibaculum suncheonense]MBD0836833.1 DUF1800 domain-containing protein [Aestuariibaculum suncheonense]
MKLKHIQHLYWRAGFGILPEELSALATLKKEKIIDNLFLNSKKLTPLKIDTSELDVILNGDNRLSSRDRKRIQDLSRKKSLELNEAWILRLMNPSELLREKMTLFWANIFVCEDNNTVYTQRYNNTLRRYALGDFKEFVNAVSKEAAMTKYLNTKQNKKQKPNENFARELMELFTLGEGHYREEDIKESAKAFTGYSHNLKGDFVLRHFNHDDSIKYFFGKSGNFSGEDIIDIILEQKQCAKFICEKVYSYFVNDSLNQTHINQMADVFYGDYNIETLMRFVFSSDWFYNSENIGNKIKSPIEFLVGINKVVPINFNNYKSLISIQKQMGQVLLDPPNVAGWKAGRNWIDSNTISFRLKLPSILLNDGYISQARLGESDAMIVVRKEAFKKQLERKFKVQNNWEIFHDNFEKIEVNDLGNYLLLCDLHSNTKRYLKTLSRVSKQEYCIQLMSLPEYQMC